jgi:signal transduction histidine kinase
VQHDTGQSWPVLVSEFATGVLMIGAGLRIRQYRPSNRCWWLLVTAGFAWYVGAFAPAGYPAVGMAAFALVNVYYAFLVWAVVAYPNGRVARRVERLLLAAVLVVLGMQVLSRVFLFVAPDSGGYGTRNWLLPIDDDRWWRGTEDLVAWAFTILMLLILVTVIARWWRLSTPGRRMLTPTLFASAALAVSVAVEYLLGWNTRIPGTQTSIYLLRYWVVGAVAVALAVGLTLLHRSRSSVVDLVGELGGDKPPVQLADTLARALGDPKLRLFTWSPTSGDYVNETGQPVVLPAAGSDRAVTLVGSESEPIAVLVHDPVLLEDPGLLNGLAAAVRLTIDNEKLQGRIQAQLDEVADSRARLLAEGDRQRRRIERDLHDGAQQRLITIALTLKLAEAQLDGKAEPAIRATLTRAVEDLGVAVNELRDLARGIHPAVLSESGLSAALESLADRSPLPVTVKADLPADLPAVVAASGYFAVAEALTNVAKHSGARAARIAASVSQGSIIISVTDNGRGGANPDDGTGLRGVADRLQAVGGSLRVSSPNGHGTQVEIKLPCVSS